MGTQPIAQFILLRMQAWRKSIQPLHIQALTPPQFQPTSSTHSIAK
jgi:hypothetical protein